MASKEVLKHGGSYVPTINDNPTSEFEAYETYSRKTIDEKFSNNGGGASGSTVVSGYDWSGKTVVFDGESITMNGTEKYPEYVAEQTGCVSVKIGQAGHPIMGDYVGQPWDFRRRLANIPANADCILVMGDCLASASTPSSDPYEKKTSTWTGRWNLAIEAIKKSFPTVPVFLVAEYPMKGRPGNVTNVPKQFEATARRYGALFISLPDECVLNLEYQTPKYGLTATDGTHCNHAGMKLFASAVIRRLKQIAPPEWIGSDTLTMDESATVAVGSTVDIPHTITGDLSIQWTSDNMDVACVMGGTVYGMTAGTATITAKTRNGNTASCVVTVTE